MRKTHPTPNPQSARRKLMQDVEGLRARLAEAEDALQAIRSGEVDAIVVSGEGGEQVFTLKGADQPYRILVETMSEGTVTLLPDGTIAYCNTRFAEMVRAPLEKVIGSPFSRFLSPPQEPAFGALLEQSRKEGSKEEFTLCPRGADDEPAPRLPSSTPVPALISARVLDQERGTGYCLVITDLTAQKQAGAALKAERQRLFDVLETLPAMVCLLTPDYHVAFANRGFRAKFGESHGRHCHEYCFGLDAPCEFCEAYQVLQTGRPHQWELTARDGSVIEAHDFPFTDVDGSPMILEMDIDITETRQTAQALERTLAELKEAQRVGRLGNWSVDFGTGQVRYSEELYRILGYPLSSPLPPFDEHGRFFTPETWTALNARVAQCRQDGSPYEIETESVSVDGTHGWQLARGEAVRDANGAVAGLRGVTMDITERKQAEQMRSRLAAIVESSAVAIESIDLDGVITSWNPGAERLYGFTPEEAIGQPVSIIAPPEHARDVKQTLERIVRDEEVRHQDTWRLCKNGTRVSVAATISPMKDAQGRIVGASSVSFDITERKRAEQALQESEAKERAKAKELEAVLEAVPVAVFISHDPECEGMTGNRMAYELTGVPAGDNPSKSAPEGKRPAYRVTWDGAEIPAGDLPMQRAAATGKPVFDGRFTMAFEDGSERHIWGNAAPLFDAEGKPCGAVGGFLDITALKQAEAALRESESRLSTLVEVAPAGIVIHGPDGRLLRSNAAAREMLGVSEDESTGKTLADPAWRFVREDGSAMPLEEFPAAQVLATKSRVTDLVMGINRGTPGEGVWVTVEAAPRFAKDGALVEVIVSFMNITERKRAEERLERANAYNRSLLEASLDAMVAIAPGGRITDVNEAAARIRGLRREELIGTESCHYFTEPEKADAAYRRAFTEGSVRDCELGLRHLDGHITPVLYNAAIYRDEKGEVAGVFAAARDITERKRAEDALRESKERVAAERQRFNNILDAMPAYVVLLSPDYRVPFANRYFEERFGKSHGKRCFEYLFNRTEPCQVCRSLEPFETNQPVNWFWTGPDGRDYDIYDFPFTDSDGSALVLEMGIDITERNRAEREVRELNAGLERRVSERTAELAAVNKELEAFTYSVAHDLRAPLRGIDGFSLALLEDYSRNLDAEAQSHLTRIRGAASRMGQLIDDLLNLSRISRAELRKQRVDLSRLAAAVVSELRKSAPDRPLDFVTPESLEVDGDANLLLIALENLLGNAWKFSARRRSARIELGAEDRDRGPVYFVRDNGVGFDMAYASKLFVPFQRLHSASEFPGTGIGLVTVASIVHKHGGEVWAEAEVDKGATFYFTLGGKNRESRS